MEISVQIGFLLLTFLLLVAMSYIKGYFSQKEE